MKNVEFYKEEMEQMFEESIGTACMYIKELDEYSDCPDCPLHKDDDCNRCDSRKVVEWLLEEHKKSIKLKQWEYDFLDYLSFLGCGEKHFEHYNDTKYFFYTKGHFKGVKDTSMTLQEILDNSEIVHDDYKWEE